MKCVPCNFACFNGLDSHCYMVALGKLITDNLPLYINGNGLDEAQPWGGVSED
jgi:hypothetical protein